MTATTVSPGLAARSWNSLLKVTAIVALIIVLAVGSFAFGRSSADDTSDSPAVATSAHAVPVPDPASCGHTANTPPC